MREKKKIYPPKISEKIPIIPDVLKVLFLPSCSLITLISHAKERTSALGGPDYSGGLYKKLYTTIIYSYISQVILTSYGRNYIKEIYYICISLKRYKNVATVLKGLS